MIDLDNLQSKCERTVDFAAGQLRNLVESMVVLSPGREIGPDDIPAQVRSPGSSPLLPVPTPGPGAGEGEAGQLRPQLEFVFRTLVELRVDMDDLREFVEHQRAGRHMLETHCLASLA